MQLLEIGRRPIVLVLACVALVAVPATAAAQVGIGARVSWVHSDTDADTDAIRFVGGQVRFGSGKWGLEVAMDRHSESFELVNEKVTETPIQASLLMRLGGGGFTPYLLGGPGWYKRKVETLDESSDVSVSTTEFGWHAGGGVELRFGKHVGIHGDYRYTFLDFNGDDDEEDSGGFISGLLPGHKGSMWTLGATVYF